MDSDLLRLPAPAESQDPGGDRQMVPARGSGLRAHLARMKSSVWGPVVAKTSAIFAGMMGLAAIGAWSTLAGAGVPVAIPSGAPAAAPSAEWIAPERPAARAPGPAPGAASAKPPEAPPPPSAPVSPGVTPDGKIILNGASAEELQKLPRVGAKRAQAIVELRRKLGRFRSATDLLRVRGIGRKTLRLMLPLLVVDAPAAD